MPTTILSACEAHGHEWYERISMHGDAFVSCNRCGEHVGSEAEVRRTCTSCGECIEDYLPGADQCDPCFCP